MLADLGISASAQGTIFRAAITTQGGTTTYLPFIRARSQSIINGHNYLEYTSSQTTTASQVPAGQGVTYDIFFQTSGGDPLNIFPAMTTGKGWVSTDPDHTDIIGSIEAATGDARLDIQALKNSPLVPAGTALPSITGLKPNQLFMLEEGNDRTLYFLTDQTRTNTIRNVIELRTGIAVSEGFDAQGNALTKIAYDADLPDDTEGGSSVDNYNTFIGYMERQLISSNPNQYIMLLYLREDMLAGAGIGEAVSSAVRFQAAFNLAGWLSNKKISNLYQNSTNRLYTGTPLFSIHFSGIYTIYS